MPRQKKYNEPTQMFSTRVPVSKFKQVGELVREFLDGIKPVEKPKKTKGALTVKDKVTPAVKKIAAKLPPVEKTETDKFACGCTIDNGLLRKPKNSPCKLTKSEHETIK